MIMSAEAPSVQEIRQLVSLLNTRKEVICVEDVIEVLDNLSDEQAEYHSYYKSQLEEIS